MEGVLHPIACVLSKEYLLNEITIGKLSAKTDPI